MSRLNTEYNNIVFFHPKEETNREVNSATSIQFLANFRPHGCQILTPVRSTVGVERFERSTSRTRTVRSTGLSHTPDGVHYTIMICFGRMKFAIY